MYEEYHKNLYTYCTPSFKMDLRKIDHYIIDYFTDASLFQLHSMNSNRSN